MFFWLEQLHLFPSVSRTHTHTPSKQAVSGWISFKTVIWLLCYILFLHKHCSIFIQNPELILNKHSGSFCAQAQTFPRISVRLSISNARKTIVRSLPSKRDRRGTSMTRQHTCFFTAKGCTAYSKKTNYPHIRHSYPAVGFLRKQITYCLPTYSVRDSVPPQPFSSAEGERKHKLSLRCRLSSKYALGAVLSFSFLGGTETNRTESFQGGREWSGAEDVCFSSNVHDSFGVSIRSYLCIPTTKNIPGNGNSLGDKKPIWDKLFPIKQRVF